MKKKIAILLAAVMTATMVPMTAFASSTNDVNKSVTVKDNQFIEDVTLKIQPGQGIEYGDTIILTIENGKIENDKNGDPIVLDKEIKGEAFDGSEITLFERGDVIEKYQYKLRGHSYGYYADYYERSLEDNSFEWNAGSFGTIVGDDMVKAQDARLPFKTKVNSKRELEVELFPILDSLAGETYQGTNKPAYYIPLPVTADGTGDVTVTIDANSTTIRGGQTFTIASSTSSSGSTTISVDEINVGSDDVEIGTLTIKESVQGTFRPGQRVTLKLNSGFEFLADANNFRISAGTNANFPSMGTKDIRIDGNTLEFDLPEKIDVDSTDGKSQKAAALKIAGLYARPEDDDNFGDIKVTVSGTSAGITKETIKVSERGDYGFSVRAIEDPVTIYAGRIGSVYNFDQLKDAGSDYSDYMNADAFRQYDLDDNQTATIEFSEITADSWNKSRKLKFTVPDGIKIADFDIDEEEDCSNLNSIGEIIDDGRTLSLNLRGHENLVNANEASKFELQLTLSADATYEGDVTVSVEGGGIGSGDVEEIVVAKVVSPITISAETTKTNLGYQKVATSDIVLTEAEDGVLVKNGDVTIAIDSVYGEDELGFADENIDYEIDGDLKIKNFKVNKGVISFRVDSASSDASTIKIKNVQIGTTRSVPQGKYGLKVGGSAIISNYSEDLVDAGDESVGLGQGEYKKGVGFFEDNEALKFADYINVITDPGTLDKTVKVTIGEKTILVDDQAYDMDVAPYIQTSSNSTMVPLRFVMVALGVDSDNVNSVDDSNKVSFDSNTKTATIFYASGTNMTTIQFQAGSNIMKVNGADIPMENGVKAEITDGRMFVPFRAIGTAINVSVGWDADTRTATYNA